MKTIYHLFAMILFVLLIGFISPLSLAAQENDTTSIAQTIAHYIEGWRNGDQALLKEAFDLEAGIVLWVDKKGDSELLKSMKLSDLVSRTKPHEGYGIGYTIQDLLIIDAQMAVAVVKIPTKKSYYIDSLDLQKINNKWKIVVKSFVYFPKQ